MQTSAAHNTAVAVVIIITIIIIIIIIIIPHGGDNGEWLQPRGHSQQQNLW